MYVTATNLNLLATYVLQENTSEASNLYLKLKLAHEKNQISPDIYSKAQLLLAINYAKDGSIEMANQLIISLLKLVL